MGSTSLGALEIPREREVQSWQRPSLLTGLGAEEEQSFLGTRGAQAEDVTKRQVLQLGEAEGGSQHALPHSPHSVVYGGGVDKG